MVATPGSRIIVTGSSNSGKSTLGAALAELRSVPFIELDGLHWEPGWREADVDVFQSRIQSAIEPDTWVMAGNYLAKQQHVSWPRADTVIFLDLPMPKVLRRCFSRTWRRWRTRETLYGGENRENLWEHLMLWDANHSLFTHIVMTHRRRRRDFEKFQCDPRWGHITFIHLRSVAEVDAFLTTASAIHHEAVTTGD